jgi:hypothetical protein
LKDDILACVETWYHGKHFERFWFVLEDFLKIIFLHGENLEFQ